MKLQVNFGDGIGVQHIAMAIIMSFSTVIGSDTAINHEMPNINGFMSATIAPEPVPDHATQIFPWQRPKNLQSL